MKCAVVTRIGPGEALYALDAADSLKAAIAEGMGAFSKIEHITISVEDGTDLATAHARAVARAQDTHAAWILFLDARDVMCQHAFTQVADKLAAYDAIWGGIYELAADETAAAARAHQLARIARIEEVLSNDPRATLGNGHFVRTQAALEAPLDPALGDAAVFDYFLRLWRKHRCIKIAEPLVYERGAFANGRRHAAIERVIGAHCAQLDFRAEFTYREERFQFVVCNPFDLIHASLLKGRFFEQAELNFIEQWVGPEASIVEAGAYVGNHVVYYARFMRPRTVVVLEPNPESAKLLQRNLQINAVQCADLSCLGVGVAAAAGRYDLVCEGASNRGATRLVSAEAGAVPAVPLDEIVAGRVDFMKIDVEGMELDALAGAHRVIAQWRPKIMIEVFKPHAARFEAWREAQRYRIARRFENVYAVNYCIEPVDG